MRTEEGFKDIVSSAKETLSKGKGMKEAEEYLAKQARNIFYGIRAKVLEQKEKVWCETFEEFYDLPESMLVEGSPEEKVLLRILMWLDLGDIPFKHMSRFLTPQKPTLKKAHIYGDTQLVLLKGLTINPLIIFRDSMHFTFMEGMQSIVDGGYLLVLPNSLQNPEKVVAHGGSYEGFFACFLHDFEHISNIIQNDTLMNVLQPGLHKSFAREVLCLIEENWSNTGIEYTLSGFFVLHEVLLMMGIDQLFVCDYTHLFEEYIQYWQVADKNMHSLVSRVLLNKEVLVDDPRIAELVQSYGRRMIKQVMKKIVIIGTKASQRLDIDRLYSKWSGVQDAHMTAEQCYSYVIKKILGMFVDVHHINKKQEKALRELVDVYLHKQDKGIFLQATSFQKGRVYKGHYGTIFVLPLSPDVLKKWSCLQRQDFLKNIAIAMGDEDAYDTFPVLGR